MREVFGAVLPPDLVAAICEIRRRCEAAVRRESLMHYTDHTIAHLDQVATNFLALAKASSTSPHRLNDYEYFVGLAACYFHDVALQRTIESRKDVDRLAAYDFVMQRNRHGIAAANWITREVQGNIDDAQESALPPPPPLGTDSSETVAKLCLYAVPLCKYHCSDPPADPLKERMLLGKRLRIQLLLALLRLADALHLDYKRVDMDLLRQHEIPVESELHWWRHHFTDSVSIGESATIEIVMSFPRLSRPEEDFFKGATHDYVLRELDYFKWILRENGIPADLLPITVDDTFSSMKRPPSEKLKAFLAAQGKIPEVHASQQARARVIPGRKRTRSFAEEQWGTTGHPWTDLPTSYIREEFVTTQQMEQYIEMVGRFLDSPRGEIRMVYGARGSGKTTFLHSVRDIYGADVTPIYLDLSVVFGNLESASQLYAWLFEQILEGLGASGASVPMQEIPEQLRGHIASQAKPILVLIDNMDRYLQEPDVATIRRFFEIAQRSLEDLKERSAVLITAHGSWKSFLDKEDLSYLGAAPSWHLSSMEPPEIRNLLDKRLRISGSSYEKMFTPDAYFLIHRASKGNPRVAIGDCGYLFEEAIARHVPRIDEDFIREYLNLEIGNRLHEVLYRTAKATPVVAKFMDAAYRYHKAVDLTSYSQDYAWEMVRALVKGESLSLETVPDNLRPAFSMIAELSSKGNSFEWRPSKPLTRSLELLKKEGISLPELVGLYKTRPLLPSGRDPADVVIAAPRPLRPESNKLEQMAGENLTKLQQDAGDRSSALAARYALEYKILIFLQEADLTRPSSYEFHVNGLLQVGGRNVSKYPWKHRRDLRRLLDMVRNHPRHFDSLPSMVLVDNDTYPFLENKDLLLGRDQHALLRLACEKGIRELDAATGELATRAAAKTSAARPKTTPRSRRP